MLWSDTGQQLRLRLTSAILKVKGFICCLPAVPHRHSANHIAPATDSVSDLTKALPFPNMASKIISLPTLDLVWINNKAIANIANSVAAQLPHYFTAL